MSLELLTWYMLLVSHCELLEFSITSCKNRQQEVRAKQKQKVLVGKRCFHTCCNKLGQRVDLYGKKELSRSNVSIKFRHNVHLYGNNPYENGYLKRDQAAAGACRPGNEANGKNPSSELLPSGCGRWEQTAAGGSAAPPRAPPSPRGISGRARHVRAAEMPVRRLLGGVRLTSVGLADLRGVREPSEPRSEGGHPGPPVLAVPAAGAAPHGCGRTRALGRVAPAPPGLGAPPYPRSSPGLRRAPPGRSVGSRAWQRWLLSPWVTRGPPCRCRLTGQRVGAGVPQGPGSLRAAAELLCARWVCCPAPSRQVKLRAAVPLPGV